MSGSSVLPDHASRACISWLYRFSYFDFTFLPDADCGRFKGSRLFPLYRRAAFKQDFFQKRARAYPRIFMLSEQHVHYQRCILDYVRPVRYSDPENGPDGIQDLLSDCPDDNRCKSGKHVHPDRKSAEPLPVFPFRNESSGIFMADAAFYRTCGRASGSLFLLWNRTRINQYSGRKVLVSRQKRSSVFRDPFPFLPVFCRRLSARPGTSDSCCRPSFLSKEDLVCKN